ncbi:excalibur calcium-binding domain-containing protein [Cytobacillus sp. AMY 15.2]|nr:excalibur calcium-binding domain-containing protein [Cytobacillus sp. AMY 15.2]MCM3090169.1 excalibur calcium-binding domain-containing protein [Cytobacillus sp. AMY 15.2]
MHRIKKSISEWGANDHPAYASKHDRDKDNWACER